MTGLVPGRFDGKTGTEEEYVGDMFNCDQETTLKVERVTSTEGVSAGMRDAIGLERLKGLR